MKQMAFFRETNLW